MGRRNNLTHNTNPVPSKPYMPWLAVPVVSSEDPAKCSCFSQDLPAIKILQVTARKVTLEGTGPGQGAMTQPKPGQSGWDWKEVAGSGGTKEVTFPGLSRAWRGGRQMAGFRLERSVGGCVLLEGADFSRGLVWGENHRLRWGEDRTMCTEHAL